MTTPFSNLVPDARAFFADLAPNNRKDWFEANKARYTDLVRKPAEALADLLTTEFSALTGAGLTAKVYRINRDVRFSRDKSPYNTHLHMLWSSGAEDRPGFFFAVSPAGVTFAAGAMAFSNAGLDRVRHAIATTPAPWISAIAAARAQGGDLADWGEAPLKRVPKPWDDTHPAAELLRRKSLILTLPLEGADLSHGLPTVLLAAAERLLPFWSCLAAGDPA